MDSLTEPRMPGLHAALKSATGAAHARLENALALSLPPVPRARMLAVLQAFWGFHAVWEPLAVRQDEDGTQRPGRLGLLADDLAAFGMRPGEIETLPRCTEAQGLGATPARKLGVTYVLEGATLGGQALNRALADEDWMPAAGLRYFNPYGDATATQWRGTLAMLQRGSSAEADPQIIAGAAETFALLQSWFARAGL